jgi:glycine oxidase
MPPLAGARFMEADVSFRPASIDGLPLIGPSGIAGLWMAAGHFRNGILLAPATATMIASMIAGTSDARETSPFDPRRLGATS